MAEQQNTRKVGSSKKKISTKTIKRLFASSRNKCAFLECDTDLVSKTSVVADTAHIEGEKPGSARYNPSQSDGERFGYDNLILLCPSDHRLVDNDPTTFTVEVLKKYKQEHENSGGLELQLIIENERIEKAVVIENHERSFQSNMLYIYLDNKGYVDVHNFQITVAWPMEGFSAGIWDRTGNLSEKWESLPKEKRYAHKETVHGKEKLLVGQLLVKRFDGHTGKVIYKVYADRMKPIEDEIVITKEADKSYLGR